MKKKLLALLMVMAIMISLAACGGKNGANDAGGNNGTQDQVQTDNQNTQDGQNTQDDQTAQPGENGQEDGQALEEPETGGGEAPDLSGRPAFPVPGSGEDKDGEEDGSTSETEDSGEDGQAPDQTVEPGITHTDVTLFHQGETFDLLPTMVTGAYAAAYASEDETVVTVDQEGTVTAVAPGTANVTLHLECESGQYDFTCIVRCNWEAEADIPASGSGETGETGGTDDTGSAGEAKPASAPSVSEFYTTLSGSYDVLESLGAVEGEVLEATYPGLASAAGVEDVMVMEPVISFSTVAVALVKLSDGADAAQVQAVKDILQARLDSQADGGAYYLGASDAWAKGVVVSAGDYVGMFVHADAAQDMAEMFLSTYGG